jgi:L-ascorbate metabolism protein UlaG (beta-lactamase superfamily)
VAEPDAPAERPDAEVTFLGVQGFLVGYRGQTLLTAPMFTRQNVIEVGLNMPIEPDLPAIEAGFAGVDLGSIHAVISGHAHYDHLLDVPPILGRAPNATLYTNLSGRNMLAALAPDRPAGCTNTPATLLARSRVIALDDELASKVDYTNCPQLKPPGAPLAGTWTDVPGARMRVMAVCSLHPDQIGPFHFGEGSVDTEQCDVPSAAAQWLEGTTLAFLVDFLDANGAPEFRVFYHDAPSDMPVGEVPPALLADKGVDLALLCVGSNDAVENQPTGIIENLSPRFALSGHWEDFFSDLDDDPQPIPFLDLATYTTRAEAALAGTPERPLVVDGEPSAQRHLHAQPGSHVLVPN